MAGKLNWDPHRYRRYLERELQRRLDASAIAVVNHAKELLSVEGTGTRTRRVRSKSGKLVRSKKLVYGKAPSRPGEPPHLQTGRLRGSVAFDRPSPYLRRVGTNVKYGKILELARNRPWLRRALLERTAFIRLLMSRPIKGI